MDEKLKKIIEHYGLKAQLKHFNSEVFELNEAIIEYEEYKRNPIKIITGFCEKITGAKDNGREHIIEELTDVLVLWEQIRKHYNISNNEVKEVFCSKVDRTIERINKSE